MNNRTHPYNISYQYLRPKKAAALRKLHEDPIAIIESPSVWQGSNAIILPVRKADNWGWGGFGGVVDQFGVPVDNSATPPMVQAGYSVTDSEYEDKKVVYCGYLMNHWGHFLVDSVSRLWYFLENDPTIDKYIFTLDEHEIRTIDRNYKEFLVLLGIWDKVVFINRPTTYREVIVPGLGFVRSQYYTPKFIEVFNTIANNIVPDPSWKAHEKIFFSRSMLKKSNPLEFGFEVIDSFVENNGYAILYPELLSLSEMIYYIRNARIVASISGTPPHNMLFGQDGQTVQIFERCAINNDYQPMINRMRHLNAVYVDANFPIYTVRMTGPFIMGYNEHVEAFALDNGNMVPPSSQYLSKKYRDCCFKSYMRSYLDLYNYQWFTEDSMFPSLEYIAEAYEESAAYFGEYLNRKKPIFWYQNFQLHYIKQHIKRILRYT